MRFLLFHNNGIKSIESEYRYCETEYVKGKSYSKNVCALWPFTDTVSGTAVIHKTKKQK